MLSYTHAWRWDACGEWIDEISQRRRRRRPRPAAARLEDDDWQDTSGGRSTTMETRCAAGGSATMTVQSKYGQRIPDDDAEEIRPADSWRWRGSRNTGSTHRWATYSSLLRLRSNHCTSVMACISFFQWVYCIILNIAVCNTVIHIPLCMIAWVYYFFGWIYSLF